MGWGRLGNQLVHLGRRGKRNGGKVGPRIRSGPEDASFNCRIVAGWRGVAPRPARRPPAAPGADVRRSPGGAHLAAVHVEEQLGRRVHGGDPGPDGPAEAHPHVGPRRAEPASEPGLLAPEMRPAPMRQVQIKIRNSGSARPGKLLPGVWRRHRSALAAPKSWPKSFSSPAWGAPRLCHTLPPLSRSCRSRDTFSVVLYECMF